MKIEELVEVYARSGFNGRQLGEAAKLYSKMIKENAVICLTVSGALTPVGFGGIIKTLIEKGFVDWIVTTGANVYHEDHFAWGFPVKQGHYEVDDMKLYEKEIVRIRDVFIKFYETLEAEDKVVQKMFRDKLYNLDFVREIIEQAAIVYHSKKSGILELGGGVPKNSAQQTGPLLDQILKRNDGGQDYIIQITDARPDTGGLSGATLQEGKSWGKVQDAHHDMITVYADSTIAFPILALYALSNQKPRKPKRLYKKLGQYYNNLRDEFLSESPSKVDSVKHRKRN